VSARLRAYVSTSSTFTDEMNLALFLPVLISAGMNLCMHMCPCMSATYGVSSGQVVCICMMYGFVQICTCARMCMQTYICGTE